jgi:two-component system OmpR family response regulator
MSDRSAQVLGGLLAARPAIAPRVLVVDDDESIRDLLTMVFEFAGFEVELAGSLLEARHAVERREPDVIVLDVMLPDGDGIELCRRLRAGNVRSPVLFLTAKDATADKVRGLTIGGDDYLTKPFSLDELIARVRALLRRSGFEQDVPDRLIYDDIVLDQQSHEVHRAGQVVALSPTEFKLLRFLLVNAGRTLSRGQILDHVWEYDFDGESRVIETYISYLRRKLEAYGPPIIQTVRGVGYRLKTERPGRP